MNACEKKSKSLLEKPDIRYPAGYPNPVFQNPDIRYPGSKSVSGTTLVLGAHYTQIKYPTHGTLRRVQIDLQSTCTKHDYLNNLKTI